MSTFRTNRSEPATSTTSGPGLIATAAALSAALVVTGCSTPQYPRKLLSEIEAEQAQKVLSEQAQGFLSLQQPLAGTRVQLLETAAGPVDREPPEVAEAPPVAADSAPVAPPQLAAAGDLWEEPDSDATEPLDVRPPSAVSAPEAAPIVEPAGPAEAAPAWPPQSAPAYEIATLDRQTNPAPAAVRAPLPAPPAETETRRQNPSEAYIARVDLDRLSPPKPSVQTAAAQVEEPLEADSPADRAEASEAPMQDAPASRPEAVERDGLQAFLDEIATARRPTAPRAPVRPNADDLQVSTVVAESAPQEHDDQPAAVAPEMTAAPAEDKPNQMAAAAPSGDDGAERPAEPRSEPQSAGLPEDAAPAVEPAPTREAQRTAPSDEADEPTGPSTAATASDVTLAAPPRRARRPMIGVRGEGTESGYDRAPARSRPAPAARPVVAEAAKAEAAETPADPQADAPDLARDDARALPTEAAAVESPKVATAPEPSRPAPGTDLVAAPGTDLVAAAEQPRNNDRPQRKAPVAAAIVARNPEAESAPMPEALETTEVAPRAVVPPRQVPAQLASITPDLPKAIEPPQPMTGLRVLFVAGSSELSAAARKDLGRLVKQLDLAADPRLRLSSFAALGDAPASQSRQLSLARLFSVRDFLVEQGLRSDQMDLLPMPGGEGAEPADRVELAIDRS